MIFQAETVRTTVQSKVPAETGESGEGRAAESKVRTLLRKPQKTKVTTLKYTVDNPSSCKISDNLSDSCKTHCKICGEAFFLGYMRTHTLKFHGIQITKYKEMYGQFEIIEKVFHKCHLCGLVVLMDSDILGGHIKGTHKMKEKDYKEKYCIYSDSPMKKNPLGVKKSSLIKNSKVMKQEEETFYPFTDKKSLVGQLAKLEKENSEQNVLKVSGSDVGASHIVEEKLLREGEDPHLNFLHDESVEGMGEVVMFKGCGRR